MELFKRQRPVLLLVDNRTRDAHGILLVYYWLKHMGCSTVLCNKRNWKAKWRALKPSVVALSYTDGAGMEELLSQVAKISKVALIPQEGAIPDRDFVVTEEYTGIKAGGGAFTKGLSKVFLWGQQTADWLLEEEVFTQEQVVISGTPRLDSYIALLTDSGELQDSRSVARRNGVSVGFATGFEKLNIYHNKNNILQEIDLRRHVQHGLYYDDDKNIEDYMWFQVARIRVFLDIIEKCFAFDKKVDVRPRPNESTEGYHFLKSKYKALRVGNRQLVWEWLTGLNSVITFESTIGLEALMLGIPVISPMKLLGPRLHEHMTLPLFVKPSFLQFYWQPETLSDTLQMVQQAEEGSLAPSPDPEGLRRYLKEYYDWPRMEPSSLTIAKELASLADDGSAQVNADDVRIPRGSVAAESGFIYKAYANWGHRLPAFALDVGHITHDLLNGTFRAMQRYHFYPWHRKDYRKAKQVWTALRDQAAEMKTMSTPADTRTVERTRQG